MISLLFGNSIKRFVALWVSIVVGLCLILAGALFSISLKLESYTVRLILDSRAKEASLALTNAVLDERRADLLWRLTGDAGQKMAQASSLEEARRIIEELDVTATTLHEERLVDEIEERFRDFRDIEETAPPAAPAEVTAATNNLLSVIERFWEINDAQMKDTLAAHERMVVILHRWLVVLAIVVAVSAVAGSAALIRRVIRPSVELSQAAIRFRQGDFSARARVFYPDELGALSRLFNDMAGDIEQREKARHEFIAAIFHDIKNPLVNLGAMLRLLHRKSLPPEESRIWLERMLRETDRIEDIIQDLTDTVQVETGRLTLQTAEMDLSQMVEEIYTAQLACITRHRIVFEREGTCMVLGDRRRLERVVVNLLSNAMKYSPEGTPITLRVVCRENRAIFSVADRGVGISPEDRKNLFQPFGRLAHTRRMAHGSGLGLYIVKKIVEAHDGSIRLDSAPGEGTTVEITLPLAE